MITPPKKDDAFITKRSSSKPCIQGILISKYHKKVSYSKNMWRIAKAFSPLVDSEQELDCNAIYGSQNSPFIITKSSNAQRRVKSLICCNIKKLLSDQKKSDSPIAYNIVLSKIPLPARYVQLANIKTLFKRSKSLIRNGKSNCNQFQDAFPSKNVIEVNLNKLEDVALKRIKIFSIKQPIVDPLIIKESARLPNINLAHVKPKALYKHISKRLLIPPIINKRTILSFDSGSANVKMKCNYSVDFGQGEELCAWEANNTKYKVGY